VTLSPQMFKHVQSSV